MTSSAGPGRPTTAVVTQRRNVQRARAGVTRRRKNLPEYLEHADVEELMKAAPHDRARLLFLIQWRTGLRVSEALNLRPADFALNAEHPTVRVRNGKGGKTRIVPVHPELQGALRAALAFGRPDGSPLIDVSRTTAHRWLKDALTRAQELGTIPTGRWVATHTLRHSAARHWLANGVPINVVSLWLGHANLQTTLIYLQILPDPLGDMARVP